MCRSRLELSNAYLLGKIGVDTAENEPLEVLGKIQFTIHFTPYSPRRLQLFRTTQVRTLTEHLQTLEEVGGFTRLSVVGKHLAVFNEHKENVHMRCAIICNPKWSRDSSNPSRIFLPGASFTRTNSPRVVQNPVSSLRAEGTRKMEPNKETQTCVRPDKEKL